MFYTYLDAATLQPEIFSCKAFVYNFNLYVVMLPILAIGNLPLCRIFPAISPYYPDIILWPILPLYIALLVYGSRRYNENHYIRLHKTVTDLPLHKWRSLRRRSTTAIWLSTAAIIADILLAIRLYHI